MIEALRRQVVVGEGGRIEIRASELQPGTSAEVIVLLPAPPPESRDAEPLASLIGSCKGMFASREEADGYLQGERDAWDP